MKDTNLINNLQNLINQYEGDKIEHTTFVTRLQAIANYEKLKQVRSAKLELQKQEQSLEQLLK